MGVINQLKQYFGWSLFWYDESRDRMFPVQIFWTKFSAKNAEYFQVAENLNTEKETLKYYVLPHRWGIAYNNNVTTQGE